MAIPFVIIYGISFFFIAFGPNSTTFVYPSEIFPVRVGTTGHGIASAMGKLGGFARVFTLPALHEVARLLAAESAAAIVSVLGLITTVFLLPERRQSLEELSAEPQTTAEKAVA